MKRLSFVCRGGVLVLLCFGLFVWVAPRNAEADENDDPGEIREGGGADASATDFTIDGSSGRVRYSVPVDIPPGPGGLEPKISLVYTGTREDGPFGLGWALPTGLIRCSERFGVPDPAHLGVSGCSRVELDGQLLVEGPGGPGFREFRTSTESFARIRFYTSGPVQGTWEVATLDGTIRRYGEVVGSPAAPIRLRTHGANPVDVVWMLTTQEDRFGNLIEYLYSAADEGFLLPTWITYANGTRRVEILYETLNVQVRDYRGGVKRVLSRRAKEIRVDTGAANKTVSRLALRYDPLPGEPVYETSRWRLLGVTRIGADCQDPQTDPCTTMPETRFEYSRNDLSGTNAQWITPMSGDAWHDETGAVVAPPSPFYSEYADVNGDGQQDVIEGFCAAGDWPCVQPSDGKRRVWIKDGLGWWVDQAWTDALTAPEMTVDYPIITVDYGPNWYTVWEAEDQGVPGMVSPWSEWTNGDQVMGSHPYSIFHSPCGAQAGTAQGGIMIHGYRQDAEVGADKTTVHTDMSWKVADLNGDGLSDLIMSATAGGVWISHNCDGTKRSQPYYVEGNSIRKAFFNTGSGWAPAPDTFTENLPDFTRLFVSGDFGVNQTERQLTGTWESHPSYGPPEFGRWEDSTDPNYATRRCTGMGLLGAGDRYQSTTTEGAPCFSHVEYEPEFVDLNGDGLTDVLVATQEDPRELPYNALDWTIQYGIERLDLGSNLVTTRAFVQKSDGSGFEAAPAFDLPFPHVGLDACPITPSIGAVDSHPAYCPEGVLPNDLGVRILDLNGDGLSDVIWTDPELIFPQGQEDFPIRNTMPPVAKGVLMNTGAGWCASTELDAAGDPMPGPCAADGIRFAIPEGYEFARRYCTRTASYTYECAPGTAQIELAYNSPFIDSLARPLRIQDVSGDGLPDLVMSEQYWSGSPPVASLNTKAWIYDPTAASVWGGASDARYEIPTAFSRGHGFRAYWRGIPELTFFLDANDDGVADVVSAANALWNHSTSTTQAAILSTAGNSDLLTVIENGQGGKIEFAYESAMRTRPAIESCSGNAATTNLECIAAAHASANNDLLPTDGSVINRWSRDPVVVSIKRTKLNESDSPATEVSYAQPRWSRDDKTTLGYRVVSYKRPDGTIEDQLYLQRPGGSGLLSEKRIFVDSSRTSPLRCEATAYASVDVVVQGSIPGTSNFRPTLEVSANHYGEGGCWQGPAGAQGALSLVQYEYDDTYGFNFVRQVLRQAPSTGGIIETRTPYESGNSYWLDQWMMGRVGEISRVDEANSNHLISWESFEYGPHGRQIERTQQQSERTQGAGNLAVHQVVYDTNGNLVREVDPDGRATEYCYDGDAQGFSGWSCPMGSSTSHSIQVAIRDNAGMLSRRVVLDPVLPIAREIHSDYIDEPGSIRTLDPFGRVSSVSLRPHGGGPDVQISSAEFFDHWTADAGGNPIPPHVEQFAYPDGAGGDAIRTATVLDGFGGTWKTIEDVDPVSSGGPIRYRGLASWSDRGSWVSGTARSATTRSTYRLACTDAFCGNLTGSAEPEAVARTLDGLGRVIRETSLDGTSVHSYRSGYRSLWEGGGGVEYFDEVLTKDGRGNLVARGLDGERLVYSQECSNMITAGSTEIPATTSCVMIEQTLYDYTPDGLIETIFDAAIASGGGDLSNAAHKISYQYDTAGRVLRINDPDAGETINTYRPGGAIYTTTNARTQTQIFSYDPIGRLRIIDKTASGEHDVTLDYASNIMKVWRETSTGYSKTFLYDEFGRLEREQRSQDGQSMLMDKSVDFMGRPRFINFPVTDMLVMYRYEGAYLKEVCEIFDEQTPDCSAKNKYYIRDVEYDELGRRKKIEYVGADRTFSYNNRYYLETQAIQQTGGNGSYSWSYSASLYDEIGNLRTAEYQETLGYGTEMDATLAYVYDTQNRVDSWTLNGSIKNFGYDSCGNLTDHEGGTQDYDHSTHAHGVSMRTPNPSSSYSEAYEYDLSGNIESIVNDVDARYFQYDSSNQLVCQGTDDGLCDKMTVLYDSSGQRISHTDVSNSKSYYYFGPDVRLSPTSAGSSSFDARISIYAFGDEVAYRSFAGAAELRLAETAGWTIRKKDLLGGGLALVSLLLGWHSAILGVRVRVQRRPFGLAAVSGIATVMCFPIAAFGGGGGPQTARRWIVTDSLGSGVLELNEDGARVEAKIFRPFGEVAISYAVETSNGTRFAGHRKDETSGLYYMNARWYDGMSGRFASVDPLVATIVRPQSLNGYSYVENNPISGIDPTGRFGLFSWMGDRAAGSASTSLTALEWLGAKSDSPQNADGPSMNQEAPSSAGDRTNDRDGPPQEESQSGDMQYELDRLRSEVAFLDRQIEQAEGDLADAKNELSVKLDMLEDLDIALRNHDSSSTAGAADGLMRHIGFPVDLRDSIVLAQDLFAEDAAMARKEILRVSGRIQSLNAQRSEKSALVQGIRDFGYHGVK